MHTCIKKHLGRQRKKKKRKGGMCQQNFNARASKQKWKCVKLECNDTVSTLEKLQIQKERTSVFLFVFSCNALTH